MTALTMHEIAAMMYRHDKTSMEDVLKDVSGATGITISQMRGKKRDRHIVRARQLAMWELRSRGIKLTAIGQLLGGRDHTTVLHGINVINKIKESE